MSTINDKCITCGYTISGAFYGAGNGKGQEFICSGCYWEHKYNELKISSDDLKRKIKQLCEEI